MGLGIGTGEILLIIVVALIIWGPQRLPEIARTIGKATRVLKKASFDFTNAITKEMEKEDEKPKASSPPPEPKSEAAPPAAPVKPPAETKPYESPEEESQQG